MKSKAGLSANRSGTGTRIEVGVSLAGSPGVEAAQGMLPHLFPMAQKRSYPCLSPAALLRRLLLLSDG